MGYHKTNNSIIFNDGRKKKRSKFLEWLPLSIGCHIQPQKRCNIHNPVSLYITQVQQFPMICSFFFFVVVHVQNLRFLPRINPWQTAGKTRTSKIRFLAEAINFFFLLEVPLMYKILIIHFVI